MEDIKTEGRPQVKVPHNLRFDADRVKQELGLMDKAWSAFIENVRKMADFQMKPDVASSFFKDLLLQKDDKELSNKAQRECDIYPRAFRVCSGTRLKQREGNTLGSGERRHLLCGPCSLGISRKPAG